MADFTVAVAKHATLTGTAADTVTLTQSYGTVEVLNRGSTNYLFVTYGRGTGVATPVSAGDDTLAVAPRSVLSIRVPGRNNTVVKVVGDGDPYSVQGVAG